MTLVISKGIRLDSGNTPAAIAGVAPTLDYRFARDRSEIEAVSLTDKLTFTRSATCAFTNAQGQLQLAGTNQPRFDHNRNTKQSLGLFLENTATNLQIRSQDFANASWIKMSAATAPISGLGPDNNTNAYKLTPSASGGYIRYDSLPSTTPHVKSVYAKAAEYSFLYINNDASSAVAKYDLSTGTVVSAASEITATMENVGNGWYRCIAVYGSGIQGSGIRFAIGTAATSSFASVYAINTGNGSSGALIWGAQQEVGSTVSSYTQTLASSVERSESAVIDGTGIITGTYTMVEKPAGCAVVSGSNIVLQNGYYIERVMVFPASLSAQQITDIRSAM